MMTSATRRLIVNADDFGQTLSIAKGIIEAHKHGIVTSTSLMINSEHAEQAVQLLRSENARLALGLHFNLTFGMPICNPSSIGSLVDSYGKFPATFDSDLLKQKDPVDIEQQVNRVLANLASRARSVEIRRELWSQFEEFIAAVGCLPTHLDSHHHVHLIPIVFEIVSEIAREHDLPVRQISPAMKQQLRSWRIPTTDFFIGDFWGAIDADLSLKRLKSALERVGTGTAELMCHPGYVDVELLQISLYSHQREREMNLICSSELREHIAHQSIELISPADLASSELESMTF